jgi:hypothetical protein
LSQSGSKLPHSKAQDDSLDRFSRRVAHATENKSSVIGFQFSVTTTVKMAR